MDERRAWRGARVAEWGDATAAEPRNYSNQTQPLAACDPGTANPPHAHPASVTPTSWKKADCLSIRNEHISFLRHTSFQGTHLSGTHISSPPPPR